MSFVNIYVFLQAIPLSMVIKFRSIKLNSVEFSAKFCIDNFVSEISFR